MNKGKELAGQVFGRLTALYPLPKTSPKYRHWMCRCECGTEKPVFQHCLTAKTNPTRSCGCLQREVIGNSRRRHGAYETPEYGVWEAMKQRCNNPKSGKFKNHGGRGIRICDRWNLFENFLADMGPRPTDKRYTIERIDNEGNYEPGNCKWATYAQQQANRRNTVMMEYAGVTKPLYQWAQEAGVNRATAYIRFCWKGLPPEKVLAPPKKRNR